MLAVDVVLESVVLVVDSILLGLRETIVIEFSDTSFSTVRRIVLCGVSCFIKVVMLAVSPSYSVASGRTGT